MGFTFIPEITLGDASALGVALVSLVIASIAYYEAHLKPGKVSVSQLTEEAEISTPHGAKSGIPALVKLKIPFYLENTGGAKATVLSMKLNSGIDLGERVYTVHKEEFGEYPKLPYILSDGDLILCTAEISIRNQHPDFEQKDARLIGKDAQEDLKSIPHEKDLELIITFKNGRGRKTIESEAIKFRIESKLVEMANQIEEDHLRRFPVS